MGFAQNTPASPIITLGITPLVIGQPASIQVLVTNPSFSPVPTGQITVDFGDDSGPTLLTISSTRVETSHVYTTAGRFTVTARYSGDANFAPATKSVTAASILSSPTYTLHLFGDSLSSNQAGWWPALLTGVLGWPRDNHACGGCSTPDMAPAIYNSIVDEHYASTWLLGQNQGWGPQLEHAALAENAWLAIPEGPAKLRAQNGAVTQSGSWTTSNLFPTLGLRSLAAGSALTSSISGSTIYVGLSSTPSTDFTVDVLIDGVDQGTASPVSGAGRYQSTEVYGLRYVVGGSADTTHVVQIVCQKPRTSGCYVDWIGSNGAAKRANLPPYVWTGVSYTTLQPVPVDGFLKKQQEIRTIESELESDGLAIRVADIASVFNMPATPECAGDGVHPNLCGNQIEATVWLSAMTFLATEAQRIDVGQDSQVVVGVPLTLQATATSGLPLKYSIISGDATVIGNQLTTQKPGNVVVEADQEGDSTVLPAAPVQFSLTGVLPTTTSLSSSSSSANPGTSVTLTATVTSNGSPVDSGIVTFFSDTTSLGTSAVNSNGIAILTTAALPVGTDTVTASYAGTAQFPASVSTPVRIQINPSPTSTSLSSSSSNANPGASVTLTATVTSNGSPVTLGVVTFLSGTTSLGTSGVNSSGIAILTTAALPVGTDTLTASYEGTAQFSASISTPISTQINPFPTSTSLSSSVSNADVGASVTLTATVTSNANPVNLGIVTFFSDTTSLGTSAVNSNGIAILTTAALPLGTDTLTASYAGTAQFSPSVSPSVSTQILRSDFSITALSPTLAVKDGHAVSTLLMVTPLHGFNQSLTLSCGGLPVGASCSFSAPVVQSDGTSTIPLTINTRPVAKASLMSDLERPIYASIPLGFIFWIRRRKSLGSHLLHVGAILTLTAIVFGALAGCGGQSNPTVNTVTITAQAQTGPAHTAVLKLTVF